ncbi:MAG: 50S ribosomal protein L24 [Chitinispirillia bacterium]|nr:50S ribosomal protein L24 [Chitinispirillia bacterium]MCL2268269.1 50S ribosomal protein L24 [Chitinispirillia bacterium]
MALGLKKDDIVVVVSGEYKGKSGKILKVMPEKSRVIVEGINFVRRHTKPSLKNQQGGIMEKEAALHISNVMLKCPKTGKPTRLGVKVLEDGSRVRYSKKAKETIG